MNNEFEYVYSIGDYDNASRRITWHIGDLNYGESASVWVLVKALKDGLWTNVAHVNSIENIACIFN